MLHILTPVAAMQVTGGEEVGAFFRDQVGSAVVEGIEYFSWREKKTIPIEVRP